MKALLVAVVVTLSASTALAQTEAPRNQVYVGVGDPGAIFMFTEIADNILTGVFSLGTVTYGDQQGGFLVNAGYERRFGAWNGLGISASWAGSRKTAYHDGREIGRVDRQMIAVTTDWRAHWLRRPAVDLYSGVSLGMLNFSDQIGVPGGQDDSITGFAFQLVPLGARFGRAWGGYAETGFGTHGFIKVGLSNRF